MVIPPQSSVGPCGSAFTVDIGAESDLTACETSINWYILSYDEVAFTGVSINSSGVISGTTTNAAVVGSSYTFIGKVTCDDSLLSQYFTVKMFIKDLCFSVVCPEGESCNPCDGTCGTPDDIELF